MGRILRFCTGTSAPVEDVIIAACQAHQNRCKSCTVASIKERGTVLTSNVALLGPGSSGTLDLDLDLDLMGGSTCSVNRLQHITGWVWSEAGNLPNAKRLPLTVPTLAINTFAHTTMALFNP